ncbi:MAG: hypothetical protein JWO56_397, partial [Acidobacteria bacterium]|nr:hypothetical protein [Acidobacteriota bacterium]
MRDHRPVPLVSLVKFAVVALVLATIGLAPPLHAQQSPAPGTAPDETAQQATPPEPTSKVTVVDAAGKPVRRATLYIIDPKGTMRKKVYSGVDGTAELPLPEKTSQAVIAVSSDEAFTIVDAKKIRAAGEAPFTLAIPASSASIEVHATLESGAPATGVSFA